MDINAPVLILFLKEVVLHYDKLLSIEHIMMQCSEFLNQWQRYHFDSKSTDDILGDGVDIDTLVGYLQAIKNFNIQAGFCLKF